MNLKKKALIILSSFILTANILLYINNTKKSSFRYFTWNIQDIQVGKLITVSFLSGFIVSMILNKALISNNKISQTKDEDTSDLEEGEEFETFENDESSFDIPPQRDVREIQPTVSVNYRFIKNTNDNKSRNNDPKAKNEEYQEDWDNFNEENNW